MVESSRSKIKASKIHHPAIARATLQRQVMLNRLPDSSKQTFFGDEASEGDTTPDIATQLDHAMKFGNALNRMSIFPPVQRQGEEQEEDKVQAKLTSPQPSPSQGEGARVSPLGKGGLRGVNPFLQRQEEEEDKINPKAEPSLQREELQEEEQDIQKRSLVQREESQEEEKYIQAKLTSPQPSPSQGEGARVSPLGKGGLRGVNPSIQRQETEEEEIQTSPQPSPSLGEGEEVSPLTKGGLRGVNPPVQTKLTIGQPGDKYEQEADSMAAKVMAMPDSSLQKVQGQETGEEEEVQPQSLAAKIMPMLQREPMEEQEEEVAQAKPQIQAKGGSLSAPDNFEGKLAQHQGGGQPLSKETRNFMEPRFGTDFSNVRIHETPDLTNAIQAQAFTHGKDIYFNSGKYNPGSSGGKELLAHELTHVVQQRSARELEKSSLVRKTTTSIIQKQDSKNYKKGQEGTLNQETVDKTLGEGFYEKWSLLINDAGNVFDEASALVSSTPYNQGHKLRPLAIEIWSAMHDSTWTLTDAVTARQKHLTMGEQISSNQIALENYYRLRKIVVKVKAENSKWSLLIKAKVFEFLSEYGKVKLRRIEQLERSFERLEKLIEHYQKKIQEASSDVCESFIQLGGNAAMGITLGAITIANPVIGATVAAGWAVSSIALDHVLGPQSEGITESDINTSVGGIAGVTEELNRGKSSLVKGSKALGKASIIAGIVIDSIEVNEAIDIRYKKIPAKLRQLNRVYAARVKEYKSLAPIVENYNLAVQIVEFLSHEANKAKKQAAQHTGDRLER